MKLSELMAAIPAPVPTFTGMQTADDMILALGFSTGGTAPASPDDYLVAQKTISEHSGAITSTTQTTQYIRAGEVTTRTGASRVITVNGDRTVGDAFQDACLDMAILYGTGSAVIVPYVYFSALSGKGETGSVSVDVTADHSGAAGENDGFSATLTSDAQPEAYTYASASTQSAQVQSAKIATGK